MADEPVSTRSPQQRSLGPGERAVTAIVVGGALTVCAFRGGSYDVVARGETAVLVLWALAGGAAIGVLPRRRLPLAAWIVLAGFLGLSLLTALAFRWTESDERTNLELARDLLLAGGFLLTAAGLRRSTADAAVAGAAGAAALVCAAALASRLAPGLFPRDLVGQSFGTDRLSYPLNYWNAIGCWGAMTAAMLLALSVHVRRSAARAVTLAGVPLAAGVVYLSYSRAGLADLVIGAVVVLAASRTRLVAAAHLAVAAAASGVVVLAIRDAPEIARGTGSAGRGGVLLALLAGMVVCAALAVALHRTGMDERLTVPRRPALILAGVALVVACVVGIAVLPGVASRGWDEFRSQSFVPVRADDPAARLGSVAGTRYVTWRSALDALSSDPLRGVGPGAFEFWFNRQAVSDESVRDAHSLYLEALAELGWPGLLLTLVIVGGLLTCAVRARLGRRDRARTGASVAILAVLAIWIFHAGVDWMWEETAVTLLVLVLVGAATVLGARTGPTTRRSVRAAIVAVALLGALVQVSPLIGTSDVRKSQAAVRSGDLRSARADALAAVNAWPWAATPLLQRALVSEASGRLDAAIEDAERAARDEPTNWQHPLILARLEAERGHPARAVAAFERARRLRPRSLLFRGLPKHASATPDDPPGMRTRVASAAVSPRGRR